MNPIIQLGDCARTVVFAVSGALAAAQRRLDITGLPALATAVGGGTIRDLRFSRTVFWIAEPLYLVLGAAPGILVFFDRMKSLEHAIACADAALQPLPPRRQRQKQAKPPRPAAPVG